MVLQMLTHCVVSAWLETIALFLFGWRTSYPQNPSDFRYQISDIWRILILKKLWETLCDPSDWLRCFFSVSLLHFGHTAHLTSAAQELCVTCSISPSLWATTVACSVYIKRPTFIIVSECLSHGWGRKKTKGGNVEVEVSISFSVIIKFFKLSHMDGNIYFC